MTRLTLMWVFVVGLVVGQLTKSPLHAFDPCTQAMIDLLRRVENVQQRMRKDGLTKYANELRDIMAGDGAVQADRIAR